MGAAAAASASGPSAAAAALSAAPSASPQWLHAPLGLPAPPARAPPIAMPSPGVAPAEKVPHPGPHNALYLKVLGDFGESGVIPDAKKSTVTEDDLPGGVARLDGGLQLLAYRAHKFSLGPLTSKSSLLHPLRWK